jgi:hypothetical protein
MCSWQTVGLGRLRDVRSCWGIVWKPTYLLATESVSLDAVAALDDIGFERDGAGAAMQLQKKAAGVA